MSSLLRTLVFALLLLFAPALRSQDSLFAFVHKQGSRAAPLALDNYKYETAKKLYEQLIRTRGDRRRPAPKFVMNKRMRYIAWMNPSRNEIGLEEAAYDVCARMGADSLNAMAALLAHEITHYYENHDWSRSFINANKQLEVSSKLEALDEGLKFEVQADYLGGMLAISAGYNTYDVFARFMKEAYLAYDLPEAIDGYPDLQERLRMSANTAGQLKQLHPVFELANLLTMVEDHHTADLYYQYLLSDFQSYEVYNNAGVNACLAALQLTDPKKLPFIFPLELDLNSRLDGLNSRSVQDPETRKAELLKNAASWFRNAIEMAPENPIGYLNLSIVYTIQEEWLDATFWASKALALSQQAEQYKQAADAQISLGVIAGIQGDLEEARRQFTFALSGNRSLAKANLSRIDAPSPGPQLLTDPPRGVEMIASTRLEDLLEAPPFEDYTELSEAVLCSRHAQDQSELLIHYAREGAEYTLFHRSCPGYTGATLRGIRHGDEEEAVRKAYGPPAKTLELPMGRCLSYPGQQLLFLLDAENKIKQWIVYSARK